MRTLLVLITLLHFGAIHADDGDGRIGLQRHTAGTYYVSATLDGYGELEFLMDTGSSYMVINETILERLRATGNAQPARELGGTMADGSRQVIPTVRLTAVRIGQNCWIHDVEAAVFPGNARPILGMNILAHVAPFTFYTEPPQLGMNVAQCSDAAPVAATTAAAITGETDVLAP